MLRGLAAVLPFESSFVSVVLILSPDGESRSILEGEVPPWNGLRGKRSLTIIYGMLR